MIKSSTPTKATDGAPGDVPANVFESFLQALEADGASTELVARLRKTLLVEKIFTEKALNEAHFPETLDL